MIQPQECTIQRIKMCLSNELRIWCAFAAILALISSTACQESRNSWKVVRDSSGIPEISARSEIAAPEGAGYATFKIRYQEGVTPPVIVDLIIESPKRLPFFPFEKYDGPVDKTKNEYIRFEVAPENQGGNPSVQVMPNGDYNDNAFTFDTLDSRVVSFLLQVKDGEKLNVTVNGPPSSIHVSFDTTGLKSLLDKIGLKAMP
jgi:hypothetical protein